MIALTEKRDIPGAMIAVFGCNLESGLENRWSLNLIPFLYQNANVVTPFLRPGMWGSNASAPSLIKACELEGN